MHVLGASWRSYAPWLILALACGCSSNNPVYPVRGKVMYDGKPLIGGGSIALMPLDDRPGKTAGGEIAEDGTYKLSTYGDGDGSIVGDFRVVIHQVTDKEPVNRGDGQPVAVGVSVPMADRIPLIYADPQKSPLRLKVEAKNLNEIDLELDRI